MTINQSCEGTTNMNTMAPPAATAVNSHGGEDIVPKCANVPKSVPCSQPRVCQAKHVHPAPMMKVVVATDQAKVIPSVIDAKEVVARTVPPARPERQTPAKTVKTEALPPVDNCENVLAGNLMAPATTRRLISTLGDQVRRATPMPPASTVYKCCPAKGRNHETAEGDWKDKLNQELLAYQQQLNRQMEQRQRKKLQAEEAKSSAVTSPDSSTPSPSTAPSSSSRPDSAKSRSSHASSESSGKVLVSTTTTNTTTTSTSRPSPVLEVTEVVDKAKVNSVNTGTKSKSEKEATMLPSREETLTRLTTKSAHSGRRTPASVTSVTRPRVVKVETPYERMLHSLNTDSTWLKELSFGKRIGFYRFRGDIGYGNFSHVKVASHILAKERVAVKILNKSRLDTKTNAMLRREIKTMESLHHPNMIQIFETIETVSKHYIVMELAGGGELFNVITEQGRFPEKEAKFFFAQIVSAIEHMHSHNLIHRDIKAENVFFADPHTIKVGDFGFSTHITSADQMLSTYCGSPPYAAPELFRDECYRGPQVDYWALGVLLYFIVTATMPFKATTIFALKKLILECRFDIPAFVSVECCQLITGFLHHDPSKRYNLQQAQATRWLRNQLPGFSYERYDLKTSLGRFQRDRRVKLAQMEGDANVTTKQHKLRTSESRPTSTTGGRLDIENIEETLIQQHQHQQEDIISKEEIETFHKLTALGIDEDLLQRHLEKGSASHVVGMFRILLHRERHHQLLMQLGAGAHAPRRVKLSHVNRAQSLKSSPVVRRDVRVVNVETNSAQHNNNNNNNAKVSRPTSKPLDRFWTSKKSRVDETTLKKLADTGNKEKAAKVNKPQQQQVIESATPRSDSDLCKRFSLKRLFSISDSAASADSQGKVIHHHIVEVKTDHHQDEQPQELKTLEHNNNKQSSGQSSPSSRPPSSQTNPHNINNSNNKHTVPSKESHPNNDVSAHQQQQQQSRKQQQQLQQFRQQHFRQKLAQERALVQRSDQTTDGKKSATLRSVASTKEHRTPANIVHDVKVVPIIPSGAQHCSPFSAMFRNLGSNAGGDNVPGHHTLRRTKTTPNVTECFEDHQAGGDKLGGSDSTDSDSHNNNNNNNNRHGKRLNRKQSQSVSTVSKPRSHCVIV